jgi:hypothetical protein
MVYVVDMLHTSVTQSEIEMTGCPLRSRFLLSLFLHQKIINRSVWQRPEYQSTSSFRSTCLLLSIVPVCLHPFLVILKAFLAYLIYATVLEE